jgi:hypothetical protein
MALVTLSQSPLFQKSTLKTFSESTSPPKNNSPLIHAINERPQKQEINSCRKFIGHFCAQAVNVATSFLSLTQKMCLNF